MTDAKRIAKLEADCAALQADVRFLARRANKAGSFTFSDDDRNVGLSSNTIISAVYGVGKQNEMPFDRSDYAACVRAVRGLPRHRRTPETWQMLMTARAALKDTTP